jgi:hypothetical protein
MESCRVFSLEHGGEEEGGHTVSGEREIMGGGDMEWIFKFGNSLEKIG